MQKRKLFLLIFYVITLPALTVSGVNDAADCWSTTEMEFVADRGQESATVTVNIPVPYTTIVPEMPMTINAGRQVVVYITPNSSVCRVEVYLRVHRCVMFASRDLWKSSMIPDEKCKYLAYGKSCYGYCPDGKVSVSTSPMFTCEIRSDNTSYWTPDPDPYDCIDDNANLKCPDDVLIYTEKYFRYAGTNWTLPISMDTNGVAWNVTYQSLIPMSRKEGTYTNVVGAINSRGQSSSCSFNIEVRMKKCHVPTDQEGATIQNSVPNDTFTYDVTRRKVCKEGYDLPDQYKKDYGKDFIYIRCLENETSGEMYWKNWNNEMCYPTWVPSWCERSTEIKGKEGYAGYNSFSYNYSDWSSIYQQNKSQCYFLARQDTEYPKMFKLKLSFEKSVNLAQLRKEDCFFEVLLYPGPPGRNTHVKVFDCTLSDTVEIKWPTASFSVVFRLFRNFTSYAGRNLIGSGSIRYNFSECFDCSYESVTGLTKSKSSLPYYTLLPSFPCKTTGCLEDSLQGFKVNYFPWTKDSMYDIYNIRCEVNINLRDGIQKICIHQTKPKVGLDKCRKGTNVIYYGSVVLNYGPNYTLEIFCDDLQGWWCLPMEVKPNYLNLSWTGTFKYGTGLQQLYVVSVSENEGLQSCSEPDVVTTPAPVKRTPRPPASFWDDFKFHLIGACIAVAGGIISCLGCLCKRRMSRGQGNQLEMNTAFPRTGMDFKTLLIISLCCFMVSGQDPQSECPLKGNLSLVADPGSYTANMTRVSVPGVNDTVVFIPSTAKEGTTLVAYWYPNITFLCYINVTVTVYRCNSSEISTSLIKDSSCDNMVYGNSCIAYCPEGFLSDAAPPKFTCELREDNSTYWTPEQDVYSCLENNTGLNCPSTIILYTPNSLNFTYISEWTIDTSNTTINGKWNLTYQSFSSGRYNTGEYNNTVGAINSDGQTSSCNVIMEVRRKTCIVPTFEEGATIEGSQQNDTFFMFTWKKKICKEGYAYPEDAEEDHVRIVCLEDSNDNLYWRYWNKQKCSRKYMPYSCERNIKIEAEKNNVGMYEFVYNFNEWEQIKEKNKTECYYHVKQSSKINRMYNLELVFDTNVTDMNQLRNYCFFQVFLYTGRQDYNSPMKVWDCSVSQNINLRWPTSEFLLVYKLFDNFTEYSDARMNWHGIIKYNFSECYDCDFESATGEAENDTQFFHYHPVPPCRLSGCIENALHGFKLNIFALDKDTMFHIFRKRCDTTFQLQNGVQKICLHQTESRYNNKYCRGISNSIPVKISHGKDFKLEVYCDDLQGWWCFPLSTESDHLNVSWPGTFRYGNDTQQLWIVSVSENRGLQTCADPVVFTTPTPVVITRTPFTFSDTTKWTIIGSCLSVGGTCLSACAGACCYKKRKEGRYEGSAVPTVQMEGMEKA